MKKKEGIESEKVIKEGKREVAALKRSSGMTRKEEDGKNIKNKNRHVLHSRCVAQKSAMKLPPQVKCSISPFISVRAL